MKFNPASAKASNKRNEVASSMVQPNTLPPKHSGVTCNGDLPSVLVFIISPVRRRCVKAVSQGSLSPHVPPADAEHLRAGLGLALRRHRCGSTASTKPYRSGDT